jgi:hypothetical protein
VAFYDYACKDCLDKLVESVGDREITDQEYQDLVLFETTHSLFPTDEELKLATTCPRCGGNNCTKSLQNSQVISYIRGNGYLDKAGAKRDMNKFKVQQEDPYAQYRQPGEVDEIVNNLNKAGKHNPNTKHFLATSTKSMTEAVKKSINNTAE